MKCVILVLWITVAEVFSEAGIPQEFTSVYETEYDPELIDSALSETGDDIISVHKIKAAINANNDSEMESVNLVSQHFRPQLAELGPIHPVQHLHSRFVGVEPGHSFKTISNKKNFLLTRPIEREDILKHKIGIQRFTDNVKEVSKRKIYNVEKIIVSSTPKPVVSRGKKLIGEKIDVHIKNGKVITRDKTHGHHFDESGGTINQLSNSIKLKHKFIDSDPYQVPNIAVQRNYGNSNNDLSYVFPPSLHSIAYPNHFSNLNNEFLANSNQYVNDQLIHPHLYLQDSHFNFPEHQMFPQLGSPYLYGIEHTSRSHLMHNRYPHHLRRHIITYPRINSPFLLPPLNNYFDNPHIHNHDSHPHYHNLLAHSQMLNHLAHPNLHSHLNSYDTPFSSVPVIPSLWYNS